MKNVFHPWVEEVMQRLEGQAHAANAKQMKAYMKGKFEFLGVKKPLRSAATAELFSKNGLPDHSDLKLIVNQLWQLPEREYAMIALELIRKNLKQLAPDDLEWLEQLIQRNSWWDTVDFLASNPVGGILMRYPEVKNRMEAYIHHDNMWINRTAIICQLKFKAKTDLEFLSSCIEPHLSSKEFFHRKAIGWSLREVSKWNPSWVRQYIYQNADRMSGLSIREASKYL